MNKFLNPSIYLFLLISIFSCQQKPVVMLDSPKPETLDFEAIADRLIRQADLQKGESVLLVAMPGKFDTLIDLLAGHIKNKEAVYLGTLSLNQYVKPETWATDFTKSTTGLHKEELIPLFKNIDLAFMMPGASTNHRPYAAMQEILEKGSGRTIHFHWSGAYDFSGSSIDIDTMVSRFYQKAILETDYAGLNKIQTLFEAEARKNWITVTTPSGTNIKFKIGDRPVTKQDGNASKAHSLIARNLIDREIEIPAGAIRVAPLEETVEGSIVFPDSEWNKTLVQGLSLQILKGKVIEIIAVKGKEAVKAELDEGGETAYSFREFALGFNPLLAIPSDKNWIPYYGYGAGVTRLSLGNNLELGGKVGGDYVRWNFFTDATVTIGSELWVKDGKLVKGLN